MKLAKEELKKTYEELGLLDQVNWSRYQALEDIKQDLLDWLFFDEEEEKKALKVIRTVERYQKYLLNKRK